MKSKTYSIFGAGASGLYTAWRLLSGKPLNAKEKNKLLKKGDILELYDWGKYDFSKSNSGTREPGARVCTWHYKDDPKASYLELGGMRYSFWDGSPNGEGHRLVTKTIELLGINKYAVPFNEGSDPLLCLRGKNMYTSEINSNSPAPYNVNGYGADLGPDDAYGKIESVAITEDSGPSTRREWCHFYQNGKITARMSENSIFQKGDYLKDIGYWNLAYDQLGQEGFSYTADGNGYSSNMVNSNSAQSFSVNDEFTPGTQYKTLTKGFSFMFTALFNEVVKLAKKYNIKFKYHPDVRLRSILDIKGTIHYTTAHRNSPDKLHTESTTNAAFLAMPRGSIEYVAQATRYYDGPGLDVLNHEKVQLYLESAIMQPSYKIGMFFETPWWRDDIENPPKYPAKLTSYFVTSEVLHSLKNKGFPAKYIRAIAKYETPKIINTAYSTKVEFLSVVEHCINTRLTYKQEQQLLTTAELDTIGPSATDMPIRQVVYFGDNALNKKGKKVYGILASYDDMQYTTFWKALELGPNGTRKIPESRDYQTLQGPRKATPVMVKMLRQQLAAVHFGPQAEYTAVPEPLETRYMDWSLPPFNAGYHAYKSHYNMGDVQQKIRKPSQLIKGKNANIFIVGETYSNDQAWVEGAYCTSESVLNDFFNIKPLISEKNYPFICPA
ncbi:MAG: hypothetical protein HKN51_09360 [Saprospiraceae bacterium]|nr:hypothetical protein [Bacteroidia bacterium]NNE15171.1 hypothetical protein [Saprospiraceae bacterium]